MESQARKVHAQAAQARERGEWLGSLRLNNEALVEYQKANDSLGFAECLADKSIVLRHLADQTGNQNYLVLAKHEINAAIEISENSGNKEALAMPYHNLGKINSDLGDYAAAAQAHEKAVENIEKNPPQSHNRPAVKADFKIHLHVAKYMSGDRGSLSQAEEALKQLEQAEEDEYNKNVWLSGAHMHIAQMLKNDNPEKAKEHLQQAKKIIDSDEKLTLRKKQWGKLATEILSS